MKTLLSIGHIFTLLLLFSLSSTAANVVTNQPSYDAVYRTSRVADAYYFLLLTKDGRFFHLHTNKTSTLTANELKSPDILSILNKKQSWGEAFPIKGKYVLKNGKLYTQRYWDSIKIISPKKIKYLNKVYYLQ